MRKSRVIWLIALALTFFSGPTFADDGFLGLGKISSDLGLRFDSGINQLRSGMIGLKNRDFTGVGLGVGRFAVTNIPLLSQSYNFGRQMDYSLRNQLQSGMTGLRNRDFTGVGLGLGRFAVANIPPLRQTYDFERQMDYSLRNELRSGMTGLRNHDLTDVGFGIGRFAVINLPVLKQVYAMYNGLGNSPSIGGGITGAMGKASDIARSFQSSFGKYLR